MRENNFSGKSTIQADCVNRRIIESKSKLNQNVTWEIDNAIACVNSFILLGNHDNNTFLKENTSKWKSIKEQLLDKGEIVTPEQMKELMSFKNGPLPRPFLSGYLYNE